MSQVLLGSRECSGLFYLLAIFFRRSNETVALTYNGRIHVSTNCIHFPMSIVIVHHMDQTKSGPWHSLNQSLAKMVKSYRYLHFLVNNILFSGPKQHHLRNRQNTGKSGSSRPDLTKPNEILALTSKFFMYICLQIIIKIIIITVFKKCL